MPRPPGLVAHVFKLQREKGGPVIADDLRPFFHNIPISSITFKMRRAGFPIVEILLMEQDSDGVHQFACCGWYSVRSTDESLD